MGKKYDDALKLIEADKFYSPKEAVALVKKTAATKFDSTVEVAFRLGVNPKYPDQQVRGALVLPNGTGKSKTVMVFAKGPKVAEAEAADETRGQEPTDRHQRRQSAYARQAVQLRRLRQVLREELRSAEDCFGGSAGDTRGDRNRA